MPNTNPYRLVQDFHRAFGHLMQVLPTPLPIQERTTRVSFMQEEMIEFLAAEDITDQADALADLLYFVYGTFVNIGVDPAIIFTAVHEANMRKLWDDGLPRWREEDGKVIKPPGWVGPEPAITAEIERQRREGDITFMDSLLLVDVSAGQAGNQEA